MEANFAASFDPATMALATGQSYTGSIDGKYQIELQFFGKELTKLYTDEDFANTCKDTTVQGSYAYLAQSSSLELSIDVCALANNEFKAVRYKEGKIRETFKGTIRYNGQVYGTWQKEGKEAKSFVLNVVSDEFTESEKLLFVQKVIKPVDQYDESSTPSVQGVGTYAGNLFLIEPKINGYVSDGFDHVNSLEFFSGSEFSCFNYMDEYNWRVKHKLYKNGQSVFIIRVGNDWGCNAYCSEEEWERDGKDASVVVYKQVKDSWIDVTKDV